MVIISKSILKEFGIKHPDAIEALNHWYQVAKSEDWGNPGDVKATFSTVDYVGNDRFVFNIRGNRYRLVAMIFFNRRTLYVRFIGTHTDYDKVDVSII